MLIFYPKTKEKVCSHQLGSKMSANCCTLVSSALSCASAPIIEAGSYILFVTNALLLTSACHSISKETVQTVTNNIFICIGTVCVDVARRIAVTVDGS